MSLKLHNSYSGTKEEFKPADPAEVRMYNCGPTVYNLNHIGNFRSYISIDILRRYLLFRGYKVNHAMNITDVDDKIIKTSMEQNKTIQEFTNPYTEAFLEDIHALNIQDVEHRPRATESIEAMIKLIQALEDGGHTYVMDGSVYFRLTTFSNYGKLSGLDSENLRTNADNRFEADEYTKEDARDFALWKGRGSEEEQSWDSPWGPGRPGWHLECSAMIRDVFGKAGVDIHAGGVDLLFPHHENEVAQSCCAYPHDNFARYWVHNEHLLVDGKKMAKSVGNFYTLRDLIDPEAAQAMLKKESKSNRTPPEFLLALIKEDKIKRDLRYVLLSFHYRTKLNFSFDNLKAADTACERLQNTTHRLLEAGEYTEADVQAHRDQLLAQAPLKPGQSGNEIAALPGPVGKAMQAFLDAMDDDVNTARALAAIFDFTKEANQQVDSGKMPREAALDALVFLYRINEILDVISFQPPASAAANMDEQFVQKIEALITERKQVRADKNWARADEIRDELQALNIVLIDTPQGTKWEKK